MSSQVRPRPRAPGLLVIPLVLAAAGLLPGCIDSCFSWPEPEEDAGLEPDQGGEGEGEGEGEGGCDSTDPSGRTCESSMQCLVSCTCQGESTVTGGNCQDKKCTSLSSVCMAQCSDVGGWMTGKYCYVGTGFGGEGEGEGEGECDTTDPSFQACHEQANCSITCTCVHGEVVTGGVCNDAGKCNAIGEVCPKLCMEGEGWRSGEFCYVGNGFGGEGEGEGMGEGEGEGMGEGEGEGQGSIDGTLCDPDLNPAASCNDFLSCMQSQGCQDAQCQQACLQQSSADCQHCVGWALIECSIENGCGCITEPAIDSCPGIQQCSAEGQAYVSCAQSARATGALCNVFYNVCGLALQ
jgi:hypothetical protein